MSLCVHASKHYYWAGPGAQPCNPSYLRGRDWEDQGLRPAQTKFETPAQPIKAEYGGMHLSSQLHGELQIGDMGINMKPYRKNT
jgi:hypothetical protein